MDLFSWLSLIVFALVVLYTFRRSRRPTLSQRLEELAKRLGVEPDYGRPETPKPDSGWGRGARPVPDIRREPMTAAIDSSSGRGAVDPIPAATRAAFPSRAARRLGIENASNLRRAVVLAAVLDRCPGLAPVSQRDTGHWNN